MFQVAGAMTRAELEALTKPALVDLVLELLARLERVEKELRNRAAPFSKGTKQGPKKQPGRKPGQGRFSHLQTPDPATVTTPPVEVSLHGACPHCGGLEVEEVGVEDAFLTDLPPQPRPETRCYRVHVGRCKHCGKTRRGVHPDVAPDQRGATAHRYGPRTMATAHALHYDVGVPVRKVPVVLETLTGVKPTQSAITQHALRSARGVLQPRYERLRAALKTSAHVHTDDTGWREGGTSAQLMVFTNEDTTVYQIRKRHRNEEVREVIPGDYRGTMVTDRGRSYDAKEFDQVQQQKCNWHVIRSIDAVLETKTGRACAFGQELKVRLGEAMALHKAVREGTSTRAAFDARGQTLTQELTYHLRDRRLTDKDNQRLLDELGWHHDRGNLVRYLKDPSIEPTNGAAERGLRPAVIARKVSHGTKNPAGSTAHATFSSLFTTLRKTIRSAGERVEAMVEWLRGPPLPVAQPP
jgi:hypothetical protein